MKLIPFVILLGFTAIFLAGCNRAVAQTSATQTPTAPPLTTATATVPPASATPRPPTATSAPPTPTATLPPATATASPPTATKPPTAEPTAAASPTLKPAPPAPAADTAALAAEGLQVYRSQYCGICHQLDAAATAGKFGPSHNGLAATAAQRLTDPGYSGTATTPADYIRESILDPQLYIVPGFANNQHPMPAYTHLTAEQVNALVQFLLQQ